MKATVTKVKDYVTREVKVYTDNNSEEEVYEYLKEKYSVEGWSEFLCTDQDKEDGVEYFIFQMSKVVTLETANY